MVDRVVDPENDIPVEDVDEHNPSMKVGSMGTGPISPA